MSYSPENIAKHIGRHPDHVGADSPDYQLGSYLSGEIEDANRLSTVETYYTDTTASTGNCMLSADKQIVAVPAINCQINVCVAESGKIANVYDIAAVGSKADANLVGTVSLAAIGSFVIRHIFTAGIYIDVDSTTAKFSVGYIPIT